MYTYAPPPQATRGWGTTTANHHHRLQEEGENNKNQHWTPIPISGGLGDTGPYIYIYIYIYFFLIYTSMHCNMHSEHDQSWHVWAASLCVFACLSGNHLKADILVADITSHLWPYWYPIFQSGPLNSTVRELNTTYLIATNSCHS